MYINIFIYVRKYIYIHIYTGISSYKEAMKFLYQKDLEICIEKSKNIVEDTNISQSEHIDQNIIFHKNDSITEKTKKDIKKIKSDTLSHIEKNEKNLNEILYEINEDENELILASNENLNENEKKDHDIEGSKKGDVYDILHNKDSVKNLDISDKDHEITKMKNNEIINEKKLNDLNDTNNKIKNKLNNLNNEKMNLKRIKEDVNENDDNFSAKRGEFCRRSSFAGHSDDGNNNDDINNHNNNNGNNTNDNKNNNKKVDDNKDNINISKKMNDKNIDIKDELALQDLYIDIQEEKKVKKDVKKLHPLAYMVE